MPLKKLTVNLNLDPEEGCNDAPKIRLDAYVAQSDILTRSQIKTRNLKVFSAEGKELKLSSKVKDGDEISLSWDELVPVAALGEDIPLDIIYEDKNVLLVNKPQGLVVHPANGNWTGTLINGVVGYLSGHAESFPGENIRPGVVHRLDKETSGLVLVAKNPDALEFLSGQFRLKTVQKRYIAITRAAFLQKEGEIESFITRDPKHRKRFTVSEDVGKFSLTRYSVIKNFERYGYVELAPRTGRTHQLRVHLKSINHPILGDPVYSRKDAGFPDATLMLHAGFLKVLLPGEEDPRIFVAPVPQRFIDILSKLEEMG